MNFAVLLFQIAVFLFSVIIHEVSHGVVAERLGDSTARLAGRLTLNPLKHIDPLGSVMLPLLLIVSGSPVLFGWAKPVPYDPRNLRDPSGGAGKIAAAGPLSNILIAVVFGIALRSIGYAAYPALAAAFSVVIYVNILLAIFNLFPVPPLDGSKVLFALLPQSETAYRIQAFLEQYSFMILFAFIFFGFRLIAPVIQFVFTVIAGTPGIF